MDGRQRARQIKETISTAWTCMACSIDWPRACTICTHAFPFESGQASRSSTLTGTQARSTWVLCRTFAIDRPHLIIYLDQSSWDKHRTVLPHQQPVSSQNCSAAYIYSLSSFIIIMAPAASRDRNDTTLRQCNKLHLLLVPARQKLVTEGCLALHRDSEGKERVRTWTVPLLARSCRGSDFLCRSTLAVS